MDKKYLKIVLNVAVLAVALSCIGGIFDPKGLYVPGFDPDMFPFSITFANPNYSGYIVTMLTIFTFNWASNDKKIWYKIYCVILHLIFTTFLFLNGSYIPIITLAIIELFEVIFIWVKRKKCPIMMLSLFSSLIPICFLVDLYPNIESLRTCQYNFFLESVAVFDNIFGTDLLDLFGIDEILGADGWDRDLLMQQTLEHITSNFKNFVFGSGAGACWDLRPHNVLLCLWVDFGLFAPVLFVTLLVLLIIKYFKLKFNKNKFGNLSVVIGYMIMLQFGSILPNVFVYFIMALGAAFRRDDVIKINN